MTDPAPPVAAAYRPPWLLRSPHVQSVLASSGVRRWTSSRARDELARRSSEHILDCGDGVRLQGFHTSQHALDTARGLVVLLHGWEGNADSIYVVNAATRLLREGFDVFRLNFRDHGATHHLNRGLFNSCLIDEAVGAVRSVQQQFAHGGPFAIAGFSLGGNFALRVALRAGDAGLALRYVLAVCPIVNPERGLLRLEAAPWFYQAYFLRKWRRSLLRKQAVFPDVEWFTRAELAGNVRELTRALVRRHMDLGSLENYLDGYSIAGDRLQGLRVPGAILAAADDPVIPIVDFRELRLPPQIELDIVTHGGHCGFIRDYALHSFADDYIAQHMRAHL